MFLAAVIVASISLEFNIRFLILCPEPFGRKSVQVQVGFGRFSRWLHLHRFRHLTPASEDFDENLLLFSSSLSSLSSIVVVVVVVVIVVVVAFVLCLSLAWISDLALELLKRSRS